MIFQRLYHSLLSTLLVLAAVLLCSPPTHAADIEPPDVYQLVQLTSAEIEHLRWFMGRPDNTQSPPKVSGVSPYEVYFQAITLYKKADRLAFEITLDNRPVPSPPAGQIEPKHVYSVVELALHRLRFVSATLETESHAAPEPREKGRTPTDVFKAIVQANRQLNLMLTRQFSPADVFEQVSTALGYADAILASLPHPPPPPLPSPVQPGKQPRDAFLHLLSTYRLVAKITERFDRSMLTIHQWTDDEDNVLPGDVYDLASVLTSELDSIHKDISGAPPPTETPPRRVVFPSDVCQRVAVLETILREILARVPNQ